MMTFNEAQEKLSRFIAPFRQQKRPIVNLGLQQALGLRLAEDINACCQVPKTDVSAMDGYAIFCEPERLIEGARFSVTAHILAGHPLPASHSFANNSAARIMTGATVPTGACTVVMQENTKREGDSIILQQTELPAKNIRFKGEEIKLGEPLLQQGTVIQPQHMSLLSSQGIHKLNVYQPIRIGIFATGDELVNPGQTLNAGEIFEANILSCLALLNDLPATLTNLGIVSDNPENIKAVLAKASDYDILISCGGVSVGDTDYVKQVIDELGHIEHHKVAMKPGKPIAFGAINNTVVMSLPGNPVSAFITLQQFFMPAIWQLCGYSLPFYGLHVQAKINQAIDKKSYRREFQRVLLQQNPQGDWQVSLPAKQDSHRVKGLAHANALLVLDEQTTHIAKDSWVSVEPFPWSFH